MYKVWQGQEEFQSISDRTLRNRGMSDQDLLFEKVKSAAS